MRACAKIKLFSEPTSPFMAAGDQRFQQRCAEREWRKQER